MQVDEAAVEVSNLQLERAEAEGGAWAASSAAHLVVRGEEKAAAGKEVATEGAERVVAAVMEVAVRAEVVREAAVKAAAVKAEVAMAAGVRAAEEMEAAG